jgi:hypothetical protein
MGRTVAELEETMSMDEYHEWAAYYESEPFGTPAEDDRWRLNYSLVWATNSDKEQPVWLDRDPEETARREAQRSLDDKIEEFFSVMAVRPEED